MAANRNKRYRRSIRLQGFDYSQAGAYFVTICTQERACLFGDVLDGDMRLNDAGEVVEQCWLAIPIHFPAVVLDAFVVMPNHVHGIVIIIDRAVGAKNFSPLVPGKNAEVRTPNRSPSKTLGSIVRGFKIGVTKWFRESRSTEKVWQRNYYEHIIRNEEALSLIRQYIENNPMQWAYDRENPAAISGELEAAWLVI
jgi:REP element-mobilizing transposase RayT